MLLCHHCNRRRRVPATCPGCRSRRIRYLGLGTQMVVEEVRTLLPTARVLRWDRDAAPILNAHAELLRRLTTGEAEVLVGTQMIAKGLDVPSVALVGVVLADVGLNLSDFRAPERTFQLLTQVAGRAGRGEAPGKVVIQSFHPDHYALKFARRQDYAGFFSHEIEFRKLMSYPPYTRLIQIIVSHGTAATACDIAKQIGAALKAQCLGHDLTSQVRILGPAPAPLEKLRGKFRYQILIKAKPACDAVSLLAAAYEELGARRVALKYSSVDVDPLSLM